MFSSFRASVTACICAATFFLPAPFGAQTPTDISTGAAPPSVTQSVSVTPDAATAEEQSANTGGHVLTFTVTNTGSETDTYDVTCVGVAKAQCGATSLTRVTLNAGQASTVDVSYSVGEPGSGLVSLVAFSPVTLTHDRGSYRVRVTQ